jgi:hypothetical protein
VKNHNIVNNSTISGAKEKINAVLETQGNRNFDVASKFCFKN